MDYSYNHELGIATIAHPSGMTVHTLLQHPGKKRAAINAYLAARYSRSAKSVIEIAQEVQTNDVQAAERLDKIFSGYGHASVAEGCLLTVCIENVPAYLALRFFNLNPTAAGQERSSRYQNFSQSSWAQPQGLHEGALSEYNLIMQEQLDAYARLYPLVLIALGDHFKLDLDSPVLKARAFDVARYLLPIGLNTSWAATMSARAWSQYIALLLGSDFEQERYLGQQLRALLTGVNELTDLGYVPEAGELIRHTEPYSKHSETITSLLEDLELDAYERLPVPDVKVNKAVNAPLHHALILLAPNQECVLEEEIEDPRLVGSHLARHEHYEPLHGFAQAGAIGIYGQADLGSLKDINRHRSLERFIPFLWAESELTGQFEHTDTPYFLPDYLKLPGLEELESVFDRCLSHTHESIRAWVEKLAKADTPKGYSIANEYGRYLIPHAHATTYQVYGSDEDLRYVVKLRVRNGGHISYRTMVYLWAQELAEQYPEWEALAQSLVKPDPASKEQFVDRS